MNEPPVMLLVAIALAAVVSSLLYGLWSLRSVQNGQSKVELGVHDLNLMVAKLLERIRVCEDHCARCADENARLKEENLKLRSKT